MFFTQNCQNIGKKLENNSELGPTLMDCVFLEML
ncbi:hypothetical protein T01_5666 [Trichinella spiralis]|uniref:Uncharacterized protein n=1 Tax=Trichinella spiralis TaxID=6334 RepID=A0A0V0YYX4_TRISP|nr:hypothetical protein T01_5666 [Trichinella spiralis]